MLNLLKILGCCSSKSEPRSESRQVPSRPDHRIVEVFITPGCMVCDACEFTCPEVFLAAPMEQPVAGNSTATVKPDASRHYDSHKQKIEEASHGCCVAVIKIKYDDGVVFDGAKFVSP